MAASQKGDPSRDPELSTKVEIAWLLKKNEPQKDIADKLGLSTSTVSRLVGRVKEEGILRVDVVPPPLWTLETGLQKMLAPHGVRRTIVVPEGPGRNLENLAPVAASEVLAAILRIAEKKPLSDSIRMAFACGSTTKAVIAELAVLLSRYCTEQKKRIPRTIRVYPSTLVSDFELDADYPHTAVTIFANAVRSIAPDYLAIKAFAPQLPKDFYGTYESDTASRRRALDDYGLDGLLKELRDADLIVMGAGTAADLSYKKVRQGFKISSPIDQEADTLEMLYTPIMPDGSPEPETEQKIIGIKVSECFDLKKNSHKEIITIAGGEEKRIPLQTIFKNPPFTTLITDRLAALEAERRCGATWPAVQAADIAPSPE